MSRAKQRENRRVKDREILKGIRKSTREEKLDLVDFCSIKDPTPSEAVKNMIRKERASARAARPRPAQPE